MRTVMEKEVRFATSCEKLQIATAKLAQLTTHMNEKDQQNTQLLNELSSLKLELESAVGAPQPKNEPHFQKASGSDQNRFILDYGPQNGARLGSKMVPEAVPVEAPTSKR